MRSSFRCIECDLVSAMSNTAARVHSICRFIHTFRLFDSVQKRRRQPLNATRTPSTLFFLFMIKIVHIHLYCLVTKKNESIRLQPKSIQSQALEACAQSIKRKMRIFYFFSQTFECLDISRDSEARDQTTWTLLNPLMNERSVWNYYYCVQEIARRYLFEKRRMCGGKNPIFRTQIDSR